MHRELDNCTRCLGTMGGVRGNENRIDGRVLCDYCHVDIMNGSTGEITCLVCGHPFTHHKMMTMYELEAAMETDGDISVCDGPRGALSHEILGFLVLVEDDEPENPCDADYMLGISS